MTIEATAPTVSGDPRVALQAGPLLGAFNAAGVLAAGDLQVATRLGRLTGEDDERVLLAVALAVRALRGGSVCVLLDDLDALSLPEGEDAVPATGLPWPDEAGWRAAIEASPLVAVGVDGPASRPVRWVNGRLYLDRYWRDEQLIRREVDARLLEAAPAEDDAQPVANPDADRDADQDAHLDAELHRLFPEPGDAQQRQATATAVRSRLTVITGGPGTGKTTTVARLLAVLQSVAVTTPGGRLRVALAAPTGKAAARLQEAVQAQLAGLPAEDRRRVGSPQASTIHRLLGWQRGSSTRFRHDLDNRLPHDVVVVDETSMVSLSLMARLLEALRPDARLVLVGDPDQLASVEAGAVLGDLVARPPVSAQARECVVRLSVVHRFSGGITDLAEAIRTGDADAALAALRSGGEELGLVETDQDALDPLLFDGLHRDAKDAGVRLVGAARDGDVPGALAALESHRLLLAHRRGPYGVRRWAETVEAWITERLAEDRERRDGWYAGQPLLVTTNDRDSGLYNGDTGVVVADGGGLVAAFGDPERPVLVRPHRLPAVETVHAMTVHRAQGSQFSAVTVLLPPPTSPLLTRELLYTAVTRARTRVRVIGSEASVRAAVDRPVRRASGLRQPL